MAAMSASEQLRPEEGVVVLGVVLGVGLGVRLGVGLGVGLGVVVGVVLGVVVGDLPGQVEFTGQSHILSRSFHSRPAGQFFIVGLPVLLSALTSQ